MEQIETLWDCCEMCGWSRVATHEVTFHGSGETYRMCDHCAQETVDRGYGTSKLGIAS